MAPVVLRYLVIFYYGTILTMASWESICLSGNWTSCGSPFVSTWKYSLPDDIHRDRPLRVVFTPLETCTVNTSLPVCDLNSIVQKKLDHFLRTNAIEITVDKGKAFRRISFLPFPVGFRNFQYSDHLLHLSVYGVKLKEDDFCPLENLKSLTLESNTIFSSLEIGCGSQVQCCKSLQALKLTQISYAVLKIPEGALQNLTTIELRSRIKTIDESAFQHLPKLKAFFLRFATLEQSLPPKLLPESIEILQIDYTNIDAFPGSFFDNLTSLTYLSLTRNKLDFSDSTHRVFKALKNLKHLVITNQIIRRLPTNLFQHFSNLEELSLAENSLHFDALSQGNFFSGLNMLISLDLSLNRIDFVPDNLFQNIPNLQTLSLEKNPLHTLTIGKFRYLNKLKTLLLRSTQLKLSNFPYFANLNNLTVLDLRSNLIDRLYINLFVGLENLEHLDLSFNKIYHLEENVFASLKNLKECLLNLNQITTISSTFGSLHSLETLRLDFNVISHIDTKALCNFTKLTLLDLRNNALQTFDYANSEHSGCMPQLKTLKLSRNKLTSFDYSAVPSSVTELLLSHNSIENITDDSNCRIKSKIKHLDLDVNKIKYLTEDSFPPFVESLNLRANGPLSIGFHAFRNLSELRSLNLLENKIRGIDRFVLGSTPNDWLQFQKVKLQMVGYSIKYKKLTDWQKQFLLSEVNQEHTTFSLPYCKNIGTSYRKFGIDVYNTNEKTPPLVCKKITYETLEFCFKNQTVNSTHELIIDSSYVQFFTHLHLDCGFQSFVNFSEGFPRYATKLNLDGGNITVLPSLLFSNFSNLELLFLNASRVMDIEEDAFSGLLRLKELHLEDNQLTSFNESHLNALPDLQKLFLHRNPIVEIQPYPSVFKALKIVTIGNISNEEQQLGKFNDVQLF